MENQHQVRIHYGATRATLEFPGGSIDLNGLKGPERSSVRRTLVESFCKSRNMAPPKIHKRKTRKRRKKSR